MRFLFFNLKLHNITCLMTRAGIKLQAGNNVEELGVPVVFFGDRTANLLLRVVLGNLPWTTSCRRAWLHTSAKWFRWTFPWAGGGGLPVTAGGAHLIAEQYNKASLLAFEDALDSWQTRQVSIGARNRKILFLTIFGVENVTVAQIFPKSQNKHQT